MAIVLVGGHSRNVGKTSVVAELISAFPVRKWTAVKITQYGHGICSINGESCGCAPEQHPWSIDEEADRTGKTDSSRFLTAGAVTSLWVRTKQGRLAEAMPSLRRRIDFSTNVIVESNSALKFIRPDIYLSVLDPETEDFKASAREYLDRCTAVVMHTSPGPPRWSDVPLRLISDKPVFYIDPPPYVTPEIISFVRDRLGWSAG